MRQLEVGEYLLISIHFFKVDCRIMLPVCNKTYNATHKEFKLHPIFKSLKKNNAVRMIDEARYIEVLQINNELLLHLQRLIAHQSRSSEPSAVAVKRLIGDSHV